MRLTTNQCDGAITFTLRSSYSMYTLPGRAKSIPSNIPLYFLLIPIFGPPNFTRCFCKSCFPSETPTLNTLFPSIIRDFADLVIQGLVLANVRKVSWGITVSSSVNSLRPEHEFSKTSQFARSKQPCKAKAESADQFPRDLFTSLYFYYFIHRNEKNNKTVLRSDSPTSPYNTSPKSC